MADIVKYQQLWNLGKVYTEILYLYQNKKSFDELYGEMSCNPTIMLYVYLCIHLKKFLKYNCGSCFWTWSRT